MESEKKHKYYKDWKISAVNTIDFLFGNSLSSLHEKYESWKKEKMRQAFGIFVGLTGGIFLLVSLAIVINEYISQGEWIGYLSVGLALFLVGLAMVKIETEK